MQYIAFMHNDSEQQPQQSEWDAFITFAKGSGLFTGGSAIGKRLTIGSNSAPHSTEHVVGYMLFEAHSFDQLNPLLEQHPVVRNGGTVEICELPVT